MGKSISEQDGSMRKTGRKQRVRIAEEATSASAQVGGNHRPRRGRPRHSGDGPASAEGPASNTAQRSLGSIKSQAGLDLTEKVKDLIRLSPEQGHLTYEDVNEAFPDDPVTAADPGPI